MVFGYRRWTSSPVPSDKNRVSHVHGMSDGLQLRLFIYLCSLVLDEAGIILSHFLLTYE